MQMDSGKYNCLKIVIYFQKKQMKNKIYLVKELHLFAKTTIWNLYMRKCEKSALADNTKIIKLIENEKRLQHHTREIIKTIQFILY